MSLSCIIFGAIGALVETSDLQRQSFNQAFSEAGLDWHWSEAQYRDLLKINGGQNRLRHFAEQMNLSMLDDEITRIHQAKTDAYEAHVKAHGLRARAGIAELIDHAKQANVVIVMASTTSPQNIDAIFDAAKNLNKSDFDFILSGDDVDAGKPDPAIYLAAARRSETLVSEILVIEDTSVSAEAAKAAGLAVVIYAGDMVLVDRTEFTTVTSEDLNLTALLNILEAEHTPIK